MELSTGDFPISPGDHYRGWRYDGIIEVFCRYHLSFSRRYPGWRFWRRDRVFVTNGQVAAAAQFCLRNGKIDVCPRELSPFAVGSFTRSEIKR